MAAQSDPFPVNRSLAGAPGRQLDGCGGSRKASHAKLSAIERVTASRIEEVARISEEDICNGFMTRRWKDRRCGKNKHGILAFPWVHGAAILVAHSGVSRIANTAFYAQATRRGFVTCVRVIRRRH